MEQIKQYLDDYTDEYDFFGSVYVKHKNNSYRENLGYSSVEHGLRNNDKTKYRLASVSKQFTAFAVMLLLDEGLIELDLPINNYLPEQLRVEPDITVHDCLCHQTGLNNFYDFESGFIQGYDNTSYNKQRFFDRYFKSDNKRGLKFEYNNAGYNLLAWMIEHLKGSYELFLEESIFIPLDMTVEYNYNRSIILDLSTPYTYDGDVLVRAPYYNDEFSMGAGGLVATVDDLIKWYNCLKDRKLLSQSAYERYFKTNLNDYCYGLISNSGFSHGGDHFGVQTYVKFDFKNDFCVIILSNSDMGNQTKVAANIEKILKGERAVIETCDEVFLNQEEIQAVVGVYLEDQIEVRYNGVYEFVRFNDSYHIRFYAISDTEFMPVHFDRKSPYIIKDNHFFGYKKKPFKRL